MGIVVYGREGNSIDDSEHDSEDLDLSDPIPVLQAVEQPRPRAVGSPLPMGAAPVRAPQPHLDGASGRAAPAPSPGRAVPAPPPTPPSGQPFPSLQRAVNALRLALPFVQRFLPVLDSRATSTASSALAARPPQQSVPAPQVNLGPIEERLVELQARHRELRDEVAEQNSSLKKVEDKLEMVREATDRNTLEQQELLEDLKKVGNKVNLLALVACSLLVISVLVNLILYLHIRRVLP